MQPGLQQEEDSFVSVWFGFFVWGGWFLLLGVWFLPFFWWPFRTKIMLKNLQLLLEEIFAYCSDLLLLEALFAQLWGNVTPECERDGLGCMRMKSVSFQGIFVLKTAALC